jgi:acetylglutamate/LysW-gamma-L-alpha-aminoadipate kinase
MTLVVKLGGAHGIGGADLLDDLAAAPAHTVLVHGGSDETTRLQERLGEPARFVTAPDGRPSRLTDRAALEAFVMATALVNRRLVEELVARGRRAFGLCGADGGAVRGSRKETLRVREGERVRLLRDQWTGRAEQVDRALFTSLLERELLPVLAPVIAGPAGELLNCDGDRLAAAVAVALGAQTLVILTNVPGLLEDPERPSTLVRRIAAHELDHFEPLARGRMRAKLLAAREALIGGVARVVLADARRERPLRAALAGLGTVIGASLRTAESPR